MKQIILIMTLVFGLAMSASAQKIESVYTDLSDTKCKTLEFNEDEGGSYKGECPGVGGFKLELLEGDLRQTINIVQKAKRTSWKLNFWSINGGFSAVGEKAEWRVIKKGKTVKPIALIVRFNVSENMEDSTKNTSYLLVTKIENNSACVTDIVAPSKNQNEKARQLADKSAGKPCYSIE